MTLPVWSFALTVGTPSLCLLMLVIGLLRRKRKERQRALTGIPPVSMPLFGRQIHQHVLAQQIDAIFNALTAIIEAERLKLKTLALNSAPVADGSACLKNGRAAVENQKPHAADDDTGRAAVAMASDGISPEQIARVLGLSHREVALALKIRESAEKRKLEAVA